MPSPLSPSDPEEVRRFRASVGLREIKSGKNKCLKCCELFFAESKIHNHICRSCKNLNSHLYLTGEHRQLQSGNGT